MPNTTNAFSDGIISDYNPLNTPNTALTYCLNGTTITYNGNELSLQNDMGNTTIQDSVTGETIQLKPGFIPLGMKENGGIIYIVSYNKDTKEGEIGSIPSPLINYSTVISTTDSFNSLVENYNDYNSIYDIINKNYYKFKGYYSSDPENINFSAGDKFIIQLRTTKGDKDVSYTDLISHYDINNPNELKYNGRFLKLNLYALTESKGEILLSNQLILESGCQKYEKENELNYSNLYFLPFSVFVDLEKIDKFDYFDKGYYYSYPNISNGQLALKYDIEDYSYFRLGENSEGYRYPSLFTQKSSENNEEITDYFIGFTKLEFGTIAESDISKNKLNGFIIKQIEVEIKDDENKYDIIHLNNGLESNDTIFEINPKNYNNELTKFIIESNSVQTLSDNNSTEVTADKCLFYIKMGSIKKNENPEDILNKNLIIKITPYDQFNLKHEKYTIFLKYNPAYGNNFQNVDSFWINNIDYQYQYFNINSEDTNLNIIIKANSSGVTTQLRNPELINTFKKGYSSDTNIDGILNEDISGSYSKKKTYNKIKQIWYLDKKLIHLSRLNITNYGNNYFSEIEYNYIGSWRYPIYSKYLYSQDLEGNFNIYGYDCFIRSYNIEKGTNARTWIKFILKDNNINSYSDFNDIRNINENDHNNILTIIGNSQSYNHDFFGRLTKYYTDNEYPFEEDPDDFKISLKIPSTDNIYMGITSESSNAVVSTSNYTKTINPASFIYGHISDLNINLTNLSDYKIVPEFKCISKSFIEGQDTLLGFKYNSNLLLPSNISTDNKLILTDSTQSLIQSLMQNSTLKQNYYKNSDYLSATANITPGLYILLLQGFKTKNSSYFNTQSNSYLQQFVGNIGSLISSPTFSDSSNYSIEINGLKLNLINLDKSENTYYIILNLDKNYNINIIGEDIKSVGLYKINMNLSIESSGFDYYYINSVINDKKPFEDLVVPAMLCYKENIQVLDKRFNSKWLPSQACFNCVGFYDINTSDMISSNTVKIEDININLGTIRQPATI